MVVLAGALLAWAGPLCAGTASQPASAPATPSRPAVRVVAVLPFAQDFTDPAGTDEPYGLRVAIAIASKWATVAGWQVVDRFTIDETMTRLKVAPGADAPAEGLSRLAEALAADCVVYGSASGAGASKRVTIRILDARSGHLALDRQYKLDYFTDLRFVLEDAVGGYTGQTFTHPSETLAILDPFSVSAWDKNPDLIVNGRFTAGASGRLASWEAVIHDQRYAPAWTDLPSAPIQEDDLRMVLWSPAPDEAARKVLQFAMPRSVAETNGLACYGDWIDVRPGDRYRVAVTYRSDGPTMLNFVKGYAAIDAGDGLGPLRREVYRRQFPKLGSTRGRWESAVVDFVPSVLPPGRSGRAPYDLRWIRVDLYCYNPPGRLYVKTVELKLVEPASATRPASNPVAPARGGPRSVGAADATERVPP